MHPLIHSTIIFLLGLGTVPSGRPAAGAQVSGQASGQVSAQPDEGNKPMKLVTFFGPGSITLPVGTGLKPAMLTAYDNGRRPVAQFSKDGGEMSVSFILFENLSGDPTAKGCRKDAIDPIVAHDPKLISKRVDGDAKGDGGALATTSYLMDMSPKAPGHFLHNMFGFAGSDKTCVEIHISTTRETPDPDEAMKAVLADFHFDLGYKPEALDYFRMASYLFNKTPALAALYYKSSLNVMPREESFTTPRRVATDQLVMALGVSGDLKSSRAVAETAIKADPDYPINYYNLACADAEQGDAAQAKAHLQQAFDRRANLLKGSSMPDPTKDDSILKLKNNKEFWDWVQTLPKS
jgi:hypothetical protein